MPLHRRSAAQENKIRLYWAIFRIFIAMTSSAFFMYFLVTEVQSFTMMQGIYNAAHVGIGAIDWINLNIDEEHCTASLMRNVTIPIPSVLLEYPDLIYNYSYLQIVQTQSYIALNAVIADCNSAGYISTELPALMEQTYQLQNAQRTVLENQFVWNETFYFNYTTGLHNLRFALLDIIAKHINYLDDNIAQLSIVLHTLIYYSENLALVKDSMVMLNQAGFNADRLYDRDNTIEYNQGVAIYYRALNQRLTGDLRDYWEEIISTPEYVRCSNKIKAMIRDSVYANFSFNREDWFYCTTTMVHDLQPLEEEIKVRLQAADEKFRNDHLTSLIISVIGIVLEFLAAGTLIHQAVPVIFLYAKFSAVVHSASVSGSLTGESLRSYDTPKPAAKSTNNPSHGSRPETPTT